jgi:type IV secretory pathway VirJ component
LISGETGWNAGMADISRRIAPKSLVVGLSSVSLRQAQGKVVCWLPAGVLEEIAKAAEGRLNLAEYRSPVLVGYGSGAALAYASLAQAPLGTFAGGMGLGFSPELATNRPLCSTRDWKPVFHEPTHTADLPKIDIKAGWSTLPGDRWDAASDAAIDTLLTRDTGKITKTPPSSASAAELERRLDALGLSLEYQWAARPHATLIFISGDGGWRDIDQKLAAYLTPRGINVVGISSIAYFWKPKTPAQGGADLRRIVDALGSSGPIFVGGYSFGADVVPFFLDSWPAPDRRRISGEVLIAASTTASFTINLLALDWVPFHQTTKTSYRVAEAVRRIQVPTFCLTGTQVKPGQTACLDLTDVATVVKLPGDHHFNGNYDAIGAAAIAFIEKNLR